GDTGTASAVLLRAGAPVDGVDAMWARRPKARRERELCSGPARLAQALGITGVDNDTDLTRGPLRLVDDGMSPPARPGRSARIGLREGRGHEHRWRWFVRGEPNVSLGRPSS